ncbi:MAG: sugar kinase [Pelagibacteraceae bacterium]|jgi:sugar/nucleoside kinase (ribokinase family)|nr:sugar kinase [Flavobacteriaceae bacterium]MBT6197482.1 sugar kinase [Pelagibacteraceae bacterium]MBT4113416.1 sugar kinase [Flavobacteriaceae bacterium]MBT4613516.1 sugar kinase [Flavobacteriaceae bacterium]MBT5246234.1 sugar kinase [Flavobacteriaceae bacterium]
MNRLLIVGTVAFDSIETPDTRVDKVLGGAATHISISASLFNINSAVISIVGGDFPTKYFEIFKRRNIDISSLKIEKNGKTFYWIGKYAKNMNQRDTLKTEVNVLENFDPVVPENFTSPNVLVLGNLDPRVQLKVMSQIIPPPKITILDTMNFWMDNAMENLKKIISKVDLICINDDEVKQLTGLNSLAEGARKILNMGPNYVIVKKGEYGSMLVDKLNTFECPAFPVKKVKDPTGAGDSFAGGLAGYLTTVNSSSFDDIKKAIMYGTSTASFSVEGFGINGIEKINYNDIINRVDFINKLL